MKIFILINRDILTGEKILMGAYISEDKVLEVMDSLPTNDFDWAYDYEEIELELQNTSVRKVCITCNSK